MDRDEELRAVWREQKTETTVMTSENVMRQDATLSRRIRARNGLEYVAAAVVTLYFGAVALRPGDAGAVLRVGAALLVGAAVHVAFDLHRRGRPIPPPAVDAPTRACIAHHRAQLTRQRDLLAAAPRWYVAPFAPGLVVFTLGVGVDLLRHGETMRAVASLLVTVDAIIATVLVFVLVVNRYATRRLTRKIDALDE
jgi:uncharacterized membrane protein YecN with MAPEG domain